MNHRYDVEGATIVIAGQAIFSANNVTRGTIIATQVLVAGRSAERRRGLLKNGSLEPGQGLWIAPCEAIHTIGMHWPIDVAFLDREYRVRKIVRQLRPWRMSFCFAASSVLELPVGALHSAGIGDVVKFLPTTGS